MQMKLEKDLWYNSVGQLHYIKYGILVILDLRLQIIQNKAKHT